MKIENSNWSHRIVVLLLVGFSTVVSAESMFVPVGTAEDIQYSQQLWDAMVQERIEGEDRRVNPPFFGGAKPHGEILELSYQNLVVGGHTGFIVVKRNYGTVGAPGVRGHVTVESVSVDRNKYLNSITVMYQREDGYDEANQNWFWAKYQPGGELFTKAIEGKKTQLAGRLLKGKQQQDNSGCIYCHSSAGGGDYVFYPQIIP